MTRHESETVVALTCHARLVGADERSRFAAAIRRLGGPALVLETCHRVEAYLCADDTRDRIQAEVDIPAGGRVLVGDEAVRHIVTVAVGGDSVVFGEDQILHQLRVALESAKASRELDGTLERLLAMALQAGRQARSWTSGPRRSLADVAVESIERLTGQPVAGQDVLVVGAGQMGSLAVRAATSAGAAVSVASRSTERAAALASATSARRADPDPGSEIGRFAGVIVALRGPWLIGPGTIGALAAASTAVIDLSVPAAVPAGVSDRIGERFLSADALARLDLGPAPDDRAASRAARLVETTTTRFIEWHSRRLGRTAAAALVDLSDRERQTELERLWRRLPDLDPESREAIEAMSRHLAARLLREPLERLGRDEDGVHERAVRELFAL